MRRVSEILAELVESLPADVADAIKNPPDAPECPRTDEDDEGLPLGWEGTEVVL